MNWNLLSGRIKIINLIQDFNQNKTLIWSNIDFFFWTNSKKSLSSETGIHRMNLPDLRNFPMFLAWEKLTWCRFLKFIPYQNILLLKNLLKQWFTKTPITTVVDKFIDTAQIFLPIIMSKLSFFSNFVNKISHAISLRIIF